MIRKYIIISLFLLPAIQCMAQEKSLGLWTGLALDKTLVKDVDLVFNVQSRWDKDMQFHDASFAQAGVEYKLNSLLRFTGEYRYSYYSWNQPQETVGHRYNFDVGFNNLNKLISDSLPVSFDLRLRMQYEYLPEKQDELYSRVRGKFSYDIGSTDFSVYSQLEVFYHFNHYVYYTEEGVSETGLLNKWRVKTGLVYDLPKGQKIRVFYLYQRFTEELKNEHIFGVNYTISLKGKLIK